MAEKWYVLVECRDERQQVELLRRSQGEGLTCKETKRGDEKGTA